MSYPNRPSSRADRLGRHRSDADTLPRSSRLSDSPVNILRVGLLVVIGLTASPAMAQRTDGQPTTGGGNGSGTAGGNGTQNGQGTAQNPADTFLSPEDAFANGVQRSGAVGQSAAGPVGVSATSPAAASAAGGRGGQIGGLGGGLGAALGNLFGGQNQTPSAGSTPPIRTRLRSAVSGPALSAGLVRQNANARLRGAGSVAGVRQNTAATPASRFGAVDVDVIDRRATLRGTVASEADRRMSELLLRLEPGVSRVDNQLSVRP